MSWFDSEADRDDYYDALDEARAEARDEARHERFLDNAIECPFCGHLWDPGFHPATRWDPPYEERPECPRCGRDPEEPQAS